MNPLVLAAPGDRDRVQTQNLVSVLSKRNEKNIPKGVRLLVDPVPSRSQCGITGSTSIVFRKYSGRAAKLALNVVDPP